MADLIIWGTGATTGTPAVTNLDGTGSVSGSSLIATNTLGYNYPHDAQFGFPNPINLTTLIVGDVLQVTYSCSITSNQILVSFESGSSRDLSVNTPSGYVAGTSTVGTYTLTSADIAAFVTFSALTHTVLGCWYPAAVTYTDIRFIRLGTLSNQKRLLSK